MGLLKRGMVVGLLISSAFGCAENRRGLGSEEATGQGGMVGSRGDGSAGSDGSQSRLVATSISVGTDMACVTVTDGGVWCWGSNDRGQLGDGTTTNSQVPVRVSGISNAVAVTAGGSWNAGGQGAARSAYACALLRDGAVKCWGDLGYLDPGAGLASSSFPTTISGLNEPVALSGGDGNACALTASGQVQCWGRSGALATGGATPSFVAGINAATAVSGKGSLSSCAVLADSSVECWGGIETASADGGAVPPAAPVTIPGVSTTPQGLDVGYGNACAITRDSGSILCWSVAAFDGDGPVTIPGLSAQPVAVGSTIGLTCALLSTGAVECWKSYVSNRIRSNGLPDSLPTPTPIAGLTDATAISAGYNDVCALTKAGSVVCWNLIGATFTGPPTTLPGF